MRALATYDDGFDRVWAEYPKHVKKKEAKKAWTQLHPSLELIDRIVAAVRWQRATPAWSDAQFIPHFASWIRGERWDDEPCDTRPLLGKQSQTLLTAINNLKDTR